MIIHARLILCAGPCCQRHVLPPTCIMYVRAGVIHQIDTSIHLSIHVRINTCAYQGSGGDSHQWAALVLPVSIHTHSSLWGGDSDWSCINLYRSVSRNIDTATCIEYWAHEGTKHASRYLTDTWPRTDQIHSDTRRRNASNTTDVFQIRYIADTVKKGQNTWFGGVSSPFSGEIAP